MWTGSAGQIFLDFNIFGGKFIPYGKRFSHLSPPPAPVGFAKEGPDSLFEVVSHMQLGWLTYFELRTWC
jgi:hypothetical protein